MKSAYIYWKVNFFDSLLYGTQYVARAHKSVPPASIGFNFLSIYNIIHSNY